jgi:hypothetical protein
LFEKFEKVVDCATGEEVYGDVAQAYETDSLVPVPGEEEPVAVIGLRVGRGELGYLEDDLVGECPGICVL